MNENDWSKNTVSRANEGNVGTSIFFCDLDLDGNCEFVAGISQGPGGYTSRSVYSVQNGELICAGTVIGGIGLYQKGNTPVLISSEHNGGGNGYYTESHYRYEYTDGTISGKLIAYLTHTYDFSDNTEHFKYYQPLVDLIYYPDSPQSSEVKEISESKYNKLIAASEEGCKKVDYESDNYQGYDWLKLSQNQKKQVLIDLYDSFQLK